MPTPRYGRSLPSLSRGALALTTALLSLGLAACGADGPPQDGAVVMTPSAPGSAAPATVAAQPDSTPTRPYSDDAGRAYDLGTIDGLEDRDGMKVAVLDRFTAKGVPDSEIAAHGLQIKPFTDPPFENLGRTKYRIPVAADATFVYHHCIAANQPVQSTSTDLAHMSSLGEPEDIVVVVLNEKGEMTHAENEPGC